MTENEKIRARALYEAAAAVMTLEEAQVTSIGTTVRKLDARDVIVALIENPPSDNVERIYGVDKEK